MTDISRKGRNIYRNHRKKVLKCREKTEILFCAAAVVTAFKDTNMAALPIIYLICCKEKASRHICALLTVTGFSLTVVTGSSYIPYIAFGFIYVVGEHLLTGKKIKSVYPALLVFAASKLYILSFAFSTDHYAVALLETAMFIFIPDAVQSGKQHLKNNLQMLSPLQITECGTVLILSAASLLGIEIWGINISLCFLIFCCFYYSVNNNTTVSMVSLVLVVFVTGKEEGTLMILGFSVIVFFSFVFLSKGCVGYFCTWAVSLAVTLAFLTSFNSFVFAVTSSVALAGCFAATRRKSCIKTEISAETYGENEYFMLTANLEKLGQAFRFLGNTVIDISELIPKNDFTAEIQDIAAAEVCRKCEKNHICWQENYSYTQKQFSTYEKAVKNGEDFDFEGLFMSQCSRTETLKKSFEQAEKFLSAQRLICKSGQHSRQVLQNQFFAMAQTLQDIVYHSSRSGIANTAVTHTVNSFLVSMGKKVNYCICFQNRNRCIINSMDYFTSSESDRIKTRLESIYGTRFDFPSVENEGESITYIFRETPCYTVEFAAKNKSRYSVCGDICEEFSTEDNRFVILADGMGTGSFASAESRTASAMLKSLLSAGIGPKTAIDITNTALNLKGTGQSCVALDILQINSYDGRCSLYKAGGAQTIVIGGGKLKFFYKDSLPVGILKDTKISQIDFELNNGDVVLMTSDGVKTDSEVADKLVLMSEKCTSEDMAELVVSLQCSTDDATAAVIRLVRV